MMISTDYMEDDTIAFGLHNGSFNSVYDMGVEDTSSFSGKALYDVASPDEGFPIDIGLPEDGMLVTAVLVGLLTLVFVGS